MKCLRWLIPVVSAMAGVCCASALTPACSLGCDCPEPRPIAGGEFERIDAKIPTGAPASLREIDVTKLVIADGMVVVHYSRGAELGTATFAFGNMY